MASALPREMRMMVGGPDIGAGPSIGLHDRRRPRYHSPAERNSFHRGRELEGVADSGTEENTQSEVTSLDKFWHRAGWLVLLLAFQSCSSFILERFEILIKTHPVIIYFLTMLVGAGGNVGGQSVVLVVRKLAVVGLGSDPPKGEEEPDTPSRLVCNEFSIGCRLALVLLVASAARCEAFDVRGMECLAICLSMIAIVITSSVLGVILPLAFRRLSIDPAHATATIGVLMDGIGVTLTCVVSCLVLGLPLSGQLEPEHITHAPPDSLRNAIQREGS
jgi:Mg/Co/Ni transporter MgtE